MAQQKENGGGGGGGGGKKGERRREKGNQKGKGLHFVFGVCLILYCLQIRSRLEGSAASVLTPKKIPHILRDIKIFPRT